MTAAVRQLLNSFDALSEEEQREAAVEVIRRTTRKSMDELSDDDLVAAAEQIFLALDADEAAHGGT